jgi:alkanesulfonate monooxygenase SsuD/methylene tetrahydromethanopterin reductase-like flavin-dependent oxidoreductase (luciferase family)
MFTVPAGRRVYGMQLPIQAQSAYFVADWEKTAGPKELARLATACDESGYAYVGVCDHVSLPESVVGGMGTHWADPIATLGWIAGFTSNVGLLTHVYVLPYRHPRVAAKQFATLDHLSEGRALIGIGAGHVQAEFDLLGVDFHARGKALDSGIPQLAAALESEFVEGFGARPLPAQSPRPPIWVAGSSPAAIKRAARLADGWLPQGPSNAEMVSMLRDEMTRVGRDVPNMMIGHITPFIYVGTPTFDVGEATISGSAQSIAERILAGTADGVNQLQVRFKARSCDELCDQIRAFATDVAPLVTTI